METLRHGANASFLWKVTFKKPILLSGCCQANPPTFQTTSQFKLLPQKGPPPKPHLKSRKPGRRLLLLKGSGAPFPVEVALHCCWPKGAITSLNTESLLGYSFGGRNPASGSGSPERTFPAQRACLLRAAQPSIHSAPLARQPIQAKRGSPSPSAGRRNPSPSSIGIYIQRSVAEAG